ncbi:MAG: UDP-N-acetylmuramate dehydrogenase [Bacteroidota bacterium]|nr:MAG: UDP-N-acetylmuramate dehydrogenase [Bacteroidota bacterium]
MTIKPDASLKTYNSFGLDVKARYLVELEKPEDIEAFSRHELVKENMIYILGGGSNILFTGDFGGVLLHPKFDSLDIVAEDEKMVSLRCGSGLNWDYLVEYCVSHGWGGLENLSAIPGNVGAAPVQNIGAYGVEAKDSITLVEGLDYLTGKPFSLSNQACLFGYRESIFKKPEFSSHLITHVSFSLKKQPELITHYGQVEEELNRMGERNIQNLRKAITFIRLSKLPKVEELGSAGSFFKNPIVDAQTLNSLKEIYPDIPFYLQANGNYKLASAWLIDKAGLKGIRKGDVGTYPNQALVIVNYGNATGKEIADFSYEIVSRVMDKFGISLEPEVIFK